MKSSGLVYVAFGYEYLLMATHSAYTAKKHNPGIVCSLVTNLTLKEPSALHAYFDHVHVEKMEHQENRDIKTRAIEYAAFEKGAFIDCDTEIQGDLSPLFRCLNRYDMVLKMDARPTRKHYQVDEGILGYEFPYWNSGVIFFRKNPKTIKIFADWRSFFHEFGKQSDQPALALALYENSDANVLSVNCLWNTFPRDVALLPPKGHASQARIWHYRDPKDYPAVAKPILEIHRDIMASGGLFDPALQHEVLAIENRYRLLCSCFYQKAISRKIWMRVLAWAYRFGLFHNHSLARIRYRKGTKFKDR